MSIPHERSSHRLLRHALNTWGTKDTVVNVPAMKPSSTVKFIDDSVSFVVSNSADDFLSLLSGAASRVRKINFIQPLAVAIYS